MTGRVLVVAGHDPSGGAGVDVDRRTVAALGLACDVVVTAFTDQDGREVRSIGARDPGQWLAQAVERLAAGPTGSDHVRALKFGLLPGAEHVRAAGELVTLARRGTPDLPVVVDPVVASSSGATFLDGAGREALLDELVPLGVVLTPNLPEAALLVGVELDPLIHDPGAREPLARALLARGARGVVLKGGHGALDPVRELVLDGARAVWLEHPRIPGPGLRGTGCRHASALACGLAAGQDLERAARGAAEHVAGCLARAGRPGTKSP